ncbi:hypothetical protein KAR10_08135, partial [bacterium]|nr:hypothetical protein [bacterium]
MTFTSVNRAGILSHKQATTMTRRRNWIGALAIMGILLLFAGTLSAGTAVSSGKEIGEQLLLALISQMEDQGKHIKSTSVIEMNGEVEITLVLAGGEIWKYNQAGQVKERRDIYGKATLYRDGMPVEERDKQGGVLAKIKYYRDQKGNIRRMEKKSGQGMESKLFDAKGNVIQSTDTHGIKLYSQYKKDAKGKVVSYCERDLGTNKFWKMTLDPKSGDVIAKIDENGIRTDMAYERDKQGRLVSIVERDTAGNQIIKRYKNDQLVEETQNGIKTTYQNVMDEKGKLSKTVETKRVITFSGVMVEQVEKKFDEMGRIVRMTDREGEHEYRYVIDKDGRVKARHEKIKRQGEDAGREILTQYDEAGRIVGQEEANRKVRITYQVDDKGSVRGSTEVSTCNIEGKIYSDVVKKKHNILGQLVETADARGVTKFRYDRMGNRLSSKGPEGSAEYIYDKYNNLVGSESRDHKSRTFTYYNSETKQAERKVKVKNNGEVEVTNYGKNQQGKRVSVTGMGLGMKRMVYREAGSDQPVSEIFAKYNGKVIVTKYNYVGDYLMSSREAGPQGVTETKFDLSGKPVVARRKDQWGRKYQTDYQYQNGRLHTTVMQECKGKTVTEYNRDEEAETITRENQVGFPRKSVEVRK